MSEISEDQRAVIEAIQRVAAAFDERDLDALLGAHYQGPECSMVPPGGQRVCGWEAVRYQLENRTAEFQYSRTTIELPEVSLFRDTAVITYLQRIDSRLHDIDFNWAGWVTDVLVRREGRWLRVHHHASDLP
ncbi:MAG: YybH family protein [Acidobacteriota bacterium]